VVGLSGPLLQKSPDLGNSCSCAESIDIYLASSGTSFTQEGGKVGRDDRTEDYGYGQDEGLL
jgi:hypothetical protein